VESIRLVLTQFTDETMSIVIAILVVVFSLLVAYWYYNRRKFHQLSHQIPASVVKNYLDSIIANSTALKSSLFRGGGLDVGEGTPAILPTSELPTGGVSLGGASSEELASKNAEIANLKSLLSQKDATIAELEKMLEAARSSNGGVSQEEYDIVKSEVSGLKNQLEEANRAIDEAKASAAAGGSDAATDALLDKVTGERDELKERLQEYEIIEEDLANLKKYQQENIELKKQLEALKGGGAAPAAEPEAPAEEVPVAQEVSAPAPEEDQAPVEEAPAAEPAPEVTAEENPVADDAATQAAEEEMPEVPANGGDQKSADELLSEFEKMLG